MRTLLHAIVVTVAGTLTLQAQELETMKRAQELGMVLASEEFCGLAYDQAAIAAWIDANVAEEDMQFAPMLQTMTRGATYELESMTPSLKTAHCRAITQSARSNGFVE